MEFKVINIKYQEFNSLDELIPEEKELSIKAIEAQKTSYAPYSNFNVGSAVLLNNGRIILGSNQENIAYPSGLCAERTALFAAGALEPNTPVNKIALVAGSNGNICDFPATPCGACRQVMAEYQKRSGNPMTIIMIGKKKILRFKSVDDILPLIFNSLDK